MLRPWLAHQARWIIHDGGLIAYPTEAVYGIGASPENRQAVMRLLRLKRRKSAKGLIIVAAGVDQVTHYISPSDTIDWPGVRGTWPGPVTWVFPASRRAPEWIRGRYATIAIRISDHPVVRQLCRIAGPLVSTSANPDSRIPAKTARRVRMYFGDKLDLVLPGHVGGLARPTEIRDAVTGEVLRAG